MVSMNELKQDMIIGMGYIGLDSDRLYRMRRGPKLIDAVASGSTIIINDATEGRPFRGLRVFGKSTQVRTTGAQLLDLSDKIGKTETKNGVTYIINDDQSITVSGKTGDYTSFYIKDMALKAGTYFLKNESRDKNKKIFIQLIGDRIKEGVFTLDKDVSNIGVYFVFNVFGGTVNIFNDTVTTMLNEGSTALPWEPYTGGKPSPSPEYQQEIVSAGESGSINVDVGGGNLFKTLQHSAGYYTGDQGSPVQKNANTGYSWEAELLVLPGTELTLSVITSIMSRFRCYVIDDNGIILLKHEDSSANSVDYTHTFVLPDRGAKMCLSVMEASESEGTKIMLNRGKVALPYEPYRVPQTLTLQTPNGLPGVPVSKDGNYTDSNGQQWICDEIDLERGKYIERIWKKMLDGSEVWGPYLTKGYEGFHINIMPFSSYRRNGFCDLFTVKEKSDYEESAWIGVNNSSIYVTKSRFYDPSLEDKGLANWKAFLAENPMTVMTYMDTPIERDLTPEEIAAYKALRTYGPTTVITNDAGAGMEMTYVADRKEN